MTETQDHLYAAVELAYSEARWSEALSIGQQLLGQLDPAANASLKVRLELLLGHIQLYGFGNANAAAEHYTTVSQARPAPILLDIAQQGLEHCQVLLGGSAGAAPVLDGIEQGDVVPEGSLLGNSDPDQERGEAENPATPAPALDGTAAATGLEDGSTPETIETAGATDAAFPFTPTAVARGGIAMPAAAMPWMVDLGASDPGAQPAADGAVAMASNPFLQASPVMPAGITVPHLQADPQEAAAEPTAPVAAVMAVAPIAVEVVDEPELIEVNQADLTRAEEIEVVPVEAKGGASPPLEKTEEAEVTVPPPLFTPEEEEELARGLLRVVLR
ncbi:hypothetical protein [Synechococcus sp. CCY9202]|uniref:hypothetical protein n=1 Tax=Synechococcus sp. CCY9202 TaxID=174698 RepID=UPI002B1F0A23|nr:hypothetical protein [Synechococcus sp. CCY9202]MEA5422890.1 hypothetical protein [Synechococcus sp. CCY9202]